MLKIILLSGILAVFTVNVQAQNSFNLELIKEEVAVGSITADGRSVLYVIDDSEIFIYDIANKRDRKIYQASFVLNPRMNLANTAIIFHGETGSGTSVKKGLWMIAADGTGLRPFPDARGQNGEDINPLWSPDGTALVWSRGGLLWTAKADGSAARQLVQTFSDDFMIPRDWLGNQILIAMGSWSSSDYDIYMCHQDTGELASTGLEESHAIFFGSTNELLYGLGPLKVWNVAARQNTKQLININPKAQWGTVISRSVDGKRFILDMVHPDVTWINQLFLLQLRN
jgi:Tol biopolymer transport system component